MLQKETLQQPMQELGAFEKRRLTIRSLDTAPRNEFELRVVENGNNGLYNIVVFADEEPEGTQRVAAVFTRDELLELAGTIAGFASKAE